MSDNVISIRPEIPASEEAKPLLEGKYESQKCRHDQATFYVDREASRVTCSICGEVVEAIVVLKKMLDSEWAKGRRDNADAWQRQYAEEQAEKQATKTRKAAYATLRRFGVTPEMYAEEWRRAVLLADLEAKQDYSQTLPFKGQA